MKKISVTYIISQVDYSPVFEWTALYLNKDKFVISFIFLHNKNSELERRISEMGINVYRVYYESKKNIITSLFSVMRILINNKPDIVHAHLFEASLIGLLASWMVRVKKRIHTRHNATLHHDYHPGYVKFDKLINFLSTDIVAVSENVKNILIGMEGVSERKIQVIPHGFNFRDFENIDNYRINLIKNKYFLHKVEGPVIGVISRYIEWKGVQFIIPAFIKFHQVFPSAHFIFANAYGPFSGVIKDMLSKIPEASYTEISFEEDIFALYKVFDIFVHTPVDAKSEAFGQVYVEAMASGVPCVVTLSGIASEFVQDKKNAIVVPYKNSVAIYDALILLMNDTNLKNKIIENARQDVKNLFSIDKMITKTELLYER